jgi:CDP-diacylglycerol--glycerol-3-phosphate 3-phosphatidyltransferase
VNLPNFLTTLRILLIPVFIVIFSEPTPTRSYWAAAVFVTASLTDWIDGYIARKWGQETVVGKFLDPIADKLLVLSAVILLVEIGRVAGWVAIIILGREIAVTGLRAIASSNGIVIQADEMGKYKTFVQIMAMIFLTLPDPVAFGDVGFHPYGIGTVVLWVAVGLALYSGANYFYRFWREIDR